jgi:hypothetical protein
MIKEFNQMVNEPRMNWEMIAFAMKDKAVELDELLKSAVNETWQVGTHNENLQAELTAARAEIAEWRILNGWGGTPEIINDFIKGQQTRIHLAQNLEEELDRVTEQRDRLAEALKAADECLEMATFSKNGYTRRVIDEALKSLTTKDHE